MIKYADEMKLFSLTDVDCVDVKRRVETSTEFKSQRKVSSQQLQQQNQFVVK